MKARSYLVFFAVILLTTTNACKNGRGAMKTMEATVSVKDAFDDVYKSTQEALRLADSLGISFDISSIDLSFSNVVTKEVGGSLEVLVVTAGYSRTSSKSKSATFTFEKKPVDKSTPKYYRNNEFTKYILDNLLAANTIVDKNGLGLTTIEIEIEFTIGSSLDGSVGVEISPIKLGATGNYSQENTHTITIKLSKK